MDVAHSMAIFVPGLIVLKDAFLALLTIDVGEAEVILAVSDGLLGAVERGWESATAFIVLALALAVGAQCSLAEYDFEERL